MLNAKKDQNPSEVTALAEANDRQSMASDPTASVWVNASAGTGKTKVLTDRLLRLMLPDAEGREGTAPYRILCLTYTKAGANEMLNRIMATLSTWASMTDEALSDELYGKVLKQRPTAYQLHKARTLFAEVIDAPGGMKIMTIHSFCESILGRFPLEAGLPTDFSIMSEAETSALIQKTLSDVLKGFKTQDAFTAMVESLAMDINFDQMMSLLHDILSQRARFVQMLERHGGLEPLIDAVYSLHDISDRTLDSERILTQFFDTLDDSHLAYIAENLESHGGKRAQERLPYIAILRDKALDVQMRYQALAGSFFRKNDMNVALSLPTKALKENQDFVDRYHRFVDGCEALHKRLSAYHTSVQSERVLRLGDAAISCYQNAKDIQCRLDFDDLILKTAKLLSEEPSWVMYKLDGGVDHILVDEAQDSNPAQWDIIESLITEFFSGRSSQVEEGLTRTLFVVGDEKQSIFNFQGADPDVFHERRLAFRKLVEDSASQWRETPLNVSFRSVESVLSIVDYVFDRDDMRQALTGDFERVIQHRAYRDGQGGVIELWPAVTKQKEAERAPWSLPQQEEGSDAEPQALNPRAETASRIAKTIRGWLDEKRVLEARSTPLSCGDILILVQKRGDFVEYMMRALKDHNIAFNGLDRMVLNQQIVVQDLLSIAEFALCPDDDLALAEILRSPFIALSDELLATLCYGRKNQTVWSRVQSFVYHPEAHDVSKEDLQHLTKTYAWLKKLIDHAPLESAYRFFAQILYRPCPQDSVSGWRSVIARLGDECADPLEEFLNGCFEFDIQHRGTLQSFLHIFALEQSSIKREVDESLDTVRIMTVHGSKGLQAPIVFLADAAMISGQGQQGNLIFPHESGLDVALWAAQKKYFSPQYIEASELKKQKAYQEKMRLLYVALTRAEDELYITGSLGGRSQNVSPDSWYGLIERGLSSLCSDISNPQSTVAAFQIEDYSDPFDPEQKRIRLVRKQDQGVQKIEGKHKRSLDVGFSELPEWFLQPVETPMPVRPLMPSRPSDEDMAVLSPLMQGETIRRFQRGNLIHALLQFLPQIPVALRQEKAELYLQKQIGGGDDTSNMVRLICDEVFAVIHAPEFQHLFLQGSQAEVPISGVVCDEKGLEQVVTGQIDRLVIDEELKAISIIDFKTNRPAPIQEKDVRKEYKRQLACYRALLAPIYPDWTIECYLLWTDILTLMRIDDLEDLKH